MKRIVVSAGCSPCVVRRSRWLYDSFEYGCFPLAGFIAWSFEHYAYKFWLDGKLVARKALEF